MGEKAAQEDKMASDSKMSANKQPVPVDIGSVLSNNLKLVTFCRIGELITHDQNLALRYHISNSFHPKSGDWIGLFQVSRSDSEKYLYMGFHWAQKHPYDKKKPLERLVHFRINEFNIPVNCGKDTYYQFLYMTASEKLLGCSSVFGIRIYLPLVRKLNTTSKTTSATTQPSTTSQQQKAIVPYEFFHQQHALLQMENAVIHLCYEDLVARHCVIDSTKYPVSHRFAGSEGLKDWSRLSFSALSSYSPSINCIGCQQSKDIIRSLRRRIFLLRKPAKQCEMKDCICSQKEIEALQNEVNRLKQRELSLEEALAEERRGKWNLIQLHLEVEQEVMQKLKEITTWLMERRSNTSQNQHQYSFTSAGQHRKDQVHINQSCKNQIGNPCKDTNNPNTSEKKSVNKRSVKVTRNGGKNSQNLTGEVQSTLKKNKVLLNHDTYSGSKIALRFLFKENAPKNTTKDQPPTAEIYSGSNLSSRFLFGEHTPDKSRKQKPSGNINCYSGSNLSLRRLFDDRFYEKTAKNQASSGNTYSGSNLALSYLFSEENNDATTNFKSTDESSSCARCSCQCKAQMLKEEGKQSVLSNTSSCKTGTERMKMQRDDAEEGLKRKAEKSVQINSKKLCVYFRNDKEEEEELHLNDATTKSNPTSRDYLVEIKDNHLVKVTERDNSSSVKQDTKSAPVFVTMPMTAGIEVTKETNATATTCCSIARPTPEPRKKSNRSPGSNMTQSTTKDTGVKNEAKKDEMIQVDGLLYSGGVNWLSSELPTLAKTTPAISSMSCQTTTEVIPPTKSLTVSVVAATDGKQDKSKDSAILTTQADISRDAKSASSLGKTGVNSRGNETSIASNPTITSINCRPATNQNLVMGSGAQGTNPRPTMMGTIQSMEMTDISSMSQLTLIKDLNIISISTSTDAASTQALHTLQKISPDATVTPVIKPGPEENKKRKRYSTTGSSALCKSNNTSDPASGKPNENNKITMTACLTPGSGFCNFICTAKPRLPKSPTMPLVPDDSARSSALIQPVKPQSPPLTTSLGTTSGAIQSTKSESKTLPLMSIRSTGTGSSASTQLSKVLPPPSCPLLPPNQTRLQTAFQQDAYDEYPPLPSALPDLVAMKPSMGHADASYAAVIRRDKKPVSRPEATMCSLKSLARLAKDIILKYYRSEEEMKESYPKAAIPKDMSPLVQNLYNSQKKIQNKGSHVNELECKQDTVDTRRQGNAEEKTANPSATTHDFLKAVQLSGVIQEPLMEENDHSSSTKEDSLAISQTPTNKEDPSKSNLTATTQQQKVSLNTCATAAVQQDPLITDIIPTKRQEPIQTDEAQTNKQHTNHKNTVKTDHMNPTQKVQAPSKRQRFKKADLIVNINAFSRRRESIKTAPAQRETSEEEAVKTELKTTSNDSTMKDQDHTTTQNPVHTVPPPERQDLPTTDKSSAIQNCNITNQTSSKIQDTNQKNNIKTDPNTTTEPEPQDYRSRFSKHLANLPQEDPSRHT